MVKLTIEKQETAVFRSQGKKKKKTGCCLLRAEQAELKAEQVESVKKL
jgi:hypothetical protein